MAVHDWQRPLDEMVRARAVEAAQGKAPFDVLLIGGQIVDVITGEIRAADIGITGPMISSVHPAGSRNDAAIVHDLAGRFVTPGFIDTHVHLESSHLLPQYYATIVVPQGTTSVFWDPHELANVLGVEGVRFAVEASRNLPLRCFIQAPSSVPSAPAIEVSGASFDGESMQQMLAWPEVLGVAEMMDMNGVLNATPRMTSIAHEARRSGKLLEGHARGLTGPRLQGYAAAGIGSDHEITSGEDLLEKLRAGLAIEIRGSHLYVIPDVVEQLIALPHLSSQLMFCTDDVPPDQLLANGGICDVLRRAIAAGLKPIDAIRMATFNAALHLGRKELGAICPGRLADILVLDDLDSISVTDVFVSGIRAAHHGRMIDPIQAPDLARPENSVHIAPLDVLDFRLPVRSVANGEASFRTIKGVRFSEWSEVRLQVSDGFAVLPPEDGPNGDLNLLFIQHRHGLHEGGPQVGLQEGLPRLHGALATTYVHDAHNLLVIGGNPEDMQVAANALIACGGGIAVVQHGSVLAIAKFPFAGMLSSQPPEEVAKDFIALREAADRVVEWKPPYWVFKTLEGMSLACNPFPYLTDLGLADGLRGELVDIEVVSPSTGGM
jgi:adenine deaminase